MKLTKKQKQVIEVIWYMLKPRYTFMFPQFLRYMMMFFLSILGILGLELIEYTMILDAGIIITWTFFVTIIIAGYLYVTALFQSKGYFFYGAIMLIFGVLTDSIWINISIFWIALFSCILLIDMVFFDKKKEQKE